MSTTEEKFKAFLEGLEMQKIDELIGLQPESLRQVAATMAGVIKESMIKAFVQGATWAIYPFDNSDEAKTKAAFLLDRGWLGKEGE